MATIFDRQTDEISVVCVYNDAQILNSCLLRSLNRIAIPVRAVLVDNTDGKFISMANALNSVLNTIDSNWIIFAHQDIEISNNSLIYFVEEANRLSEPGVVGV